MLNLLVSGKGDMGPLLRVEWPSKRVTPLLCRYWQDKIFGITFSRQGPWLGWRRFRNPVEEVWHANGSEVPAELRDVHQIANFRGGFFVTSTGTNAILKRVDHGWEAWHPLGHAGEDVNHINSLFEHRGQLYFVAHNRRVTCPSEVWCGAFGSTPRRCGAVGIHAHNVWRDQDSWFVLDSRRSMICQYDDRWVLEDRRMDAPMFLRGAAVTHEWVFVGATNFERRGSRHTCPAYIAVYRKTDRWRTVGDWSYQGRIELPAMEVCDIRVLGKEVSHPWKA